MREFILPPVVVLLLLQCSCCVLSAGQGKFLTEIDRRANPASGEADSAVPSSGFIVKPSAENWPEQDLNLRRSSSCEETYGFMPCTASAIGNLFLMAVYGYLLFLSASYMSEGSEILLSVMGPGIIGGLFLPILGAFPDSLLLIGAGRDEVRLFSHKQKLSKLTGSTVESTYAPLLVNIVQDLSRELVSDRQSIPCYILVLICWI